MANYYEFTITHPAACDDTEDYKQNCSRADAVEYATHLLSDNEDAVEIRVREYTYEEYETEFGTAVSEPDAVNLFTISR